MDVIGSDDRGRIRWRGTGFDPDPGGVTMISEADLHRAIEIFREWMELNDPVLVQIGETYH